MLVQSLRIKRVWSMGLMYKAPMRLGTSTFSVEVL